MMKTKHCDQYAEHIYFTTEADHAGLSELDNFARDTAKRPLVEFLQEYVRYSCYAAPDIRGIMARRWKPCLIERLQPLSDVPHITDALAFLRGNEGTVENLSIALDRLRVETSAEQVPPNIASGSTPWREAGLPDTLDNFLLTLQKHGGATDAKTIEHACFRKPSLILREYPNWLGWIAKWIERPRRGIYSVKSQSSQNRPSLVPIKTQASV